MIGKFSNNLIENIREKLQCCSSNYDQIKKELIKMRMKNK